MSDAAVTDTDAQAKPGIEGTDARKPTDDLDALLKEFGTDNQGGSGNQPDKQTKADAPADPALKERLEAVERRLQEDIFSRDIKPVAQQIRGDIPAEMFSDEEIVDWLNGQAIRDPRISQAWNDRHKNPGGFNKVVGALAKQFGAKFKKQPDAAATEDAAAVADAVRGASTKVAPAAAPNYSLMSNADFAKDVEQKYGFRPI